MNSWLQSLERSPGHEMVHHRNGGCTPCRRLPEVAVREPADRDFQMTERQETDIHKAFINACAWPSKSRKFHVPSRQDSDRCPGDVMVLMSPERNYGHDSRKDGTSWSRDCRIYGDRSDISAWALFVVRSTVQGKCESLEGGTATGRFTLFHVVFKSSQWQDRTNTSWPPLESWILQTELTESYIKNQFQRVTFLYFFT